MTGELAILNVGAGDTKLTFDPKNPGETKRASGIVKDMIRRGFCILIEVGKDDKGPLYRRAHDFDEATSEYIIAGEPAEQEAISVTSPKYAPRAKAKTGGRTKGHMRVPAQSTKAVAVARTAGG